MALDRKTRIVLVLIPAIAGLIAAYWQFVYKPKNKTQEYKGRVLDNDTQREIRGAKVIIEENGPPQIYLTDTDGYFYLKLDASTESVHLKVEKDHYEPFDRVVSLSRTGVEEVRLNPKAPEPSPSPSPTVTPTRVATSQGQHGAKQSTTNRKRASPKSDETKEILYGKRDVPQLN